MGSRVGQLARKQRRGCGQQPSRGFRRKGRARRGKQAQDWLVRLISGVSGASGPCLVVWQQTWGDSGAGAVAEPKSPVRAP